MDQSDTVTITVNREDALVVALGPLEYTVQTISGKVAGGGHALEVRKALAEELGLIAIR